MSRFDKGSIFEAIPQTPIKINHPRISRSTYRSSQKLYIQQRDLISIGQFKTSVKESNVHNSQQSPINQYQIPETPISHNLPNGVVLNVKGFRSNQNIQRPISNQRSTPKQPTMIINDMNSMHQGQRTKNQSSHQYGQDFQQSTSQQSQQNNQDRPVSGNQKDIFQGISFSNLSKSNQQISPFIPQIRQSQNPSAQIQQQDKNDQSPQRNEVSQYNNKTFETFNGQVILLDQLVTQPFKKQAGDVDFDMVSQTSYISRINTTKVKRTQFGQGFEQLKYKKLQSNKPHTKPTKCIVFVGQGRIVTGSSEPSLNVWNSYQSQLNLLQTLEAHTQGINCLAYDPTSKSLISGSMDQTIGVWNASEDNIRLLFRLTAHEDKVRCVALVQDRIISASDDTEIIVWSLVNGQVVMRLRNINQGRISVLFNTSDCVLLGCNKTILFYSLMTYKQVRSLQAHDNLVQCLCMLERKGERILISGSKDKKVRLWDYGTLQMISEISEDYPLSSMIYVSQMNLLILGLSGYDNEGKITMWNIRTPKIPFIEGEITDNGTVVHDLKLQDNIKSVQFYAVYQNKKMEQYIMIN